MNLNKRDPNPLACDSLRPGSVLDSIKDHLVLLLGMLAVMWGVEILDLLPFFHLDRYGIHPRSTQSALGILFAPFLHDDFRHLLMNSVPFLFLGGIVLLGGLRIFWGVTLLVTLLGGLGVWIFGASNTNHIGASGLIFGYLGFLLARGFFERALGSILVSLFVLVAYGGLLFGMLPGKSGVSWEGHLFGFLAGILAARIFFSPLKARL